MIAISYVCAMNWQKYEIKWKSRQTARGKKPFNKICMNSLSSKITTAQFQFSYEASLLHPILTPQTKISIVSQIGTITQEENKKSRSWRVNVSYKYVFCTYIAQYECVCTIDAKVSIGVCMCVVCFSACMCALNRNYRNDETTEKKPTESESETYCPTQVVVVVMKR